MAKIENHQWNASIGALCLSEDWRLRLSGDAYEHITTDKGGFFPKIENWTSETVTELANYLCSDNPEKERQIRDVVYFLMLLAARLHNQRTATTNDRTTAR